MVVVKYMPVFLAVLFLGIRLLHATYVEKMHQVL
jgi:hypothetical protein